MRVRPTWTHCHDRAFERLGGVPAVNRIDNPNTAMSVDAGAWGVVQLTYAAYARTVSFRIDACAPREQQEKTKLQSKFGPRGGLIQRLGKHFDGFREA